MKRIGFIRAAIWAVIGALVLSSSHARAQQVLRDEITGAVRGWHFSLHRGAPRVVILPEERDDRDERVALARRLLKLRCNIYVPAMPEAFYNPHTPVDSLTALVKHAVGDIFSWDQPTEILILGAGRSASVALLTSLRDFRIKCAVALSPGEFFEGYRVVEKLARLSIPVLAIYRREEHMMVRSIFKTSDRKLIVFSPTLNRTGYRALTDLGKSSGEAWLAFSIFYSEQFGD